MKPVKTNVVNTKELRRLDNKLRRKRRVMDSAINSLSMNLSSYTRADAARIDVIITACRDLDRLQAELKGLVEDAIWLCLPAKTSKVLAAEVKEWNKDD